MARVRRSDERAVTPRPNVASGAAIGLLGVVALYWLQLLQVGDVHLPDDLPTLFATFYPAVGAVVAYFAPKWDKVLYSAIALGVVIVLIALLALALGVGLTVPIIVAIVVGALQILVTGVVPNELNEAT